MVEASKSMKGTTKSLPGFLAKYSDIICRWLNDYCILFQKADDAYIDYFKCMDRDKRNSLIQDYVDIRVFLESVKQIKNKCTNACQSEISSIADEQQTQTNKESEVEEDEEIPEQIVG